LEFSAWIRCPEGSLEGGFGDGIGGGVGEGFQHCAGAVRALREQDGQGVFQRLEAVVGGTGMAVDAVEEGREIDELVACFDELEIEEIFFARHGGEFDGPRALVNGEEQDRGLRGVRGWCEVRGCSRLTCMI